VLAHVGGPPWFTHDTRLAYVVSSIPIRYAASRLFRPATLDGFFQTIELAHDERIGSVASLFPVLDGAAGPGESRAEGVGVLVESIAKRLNALRGPLES
jgi:hypothetical protein